jgi:hypothetical protein
LENYSRSGIVEVIKNQHCAAHTGCANLLPILPLGRQGFVLGKIHLVSIKGKRLGKLDLKLLQRRFAIRLGIEFVEVAQCPDSSLRTQPRGCSHF